VSLADDRGSWIDQFVLRDDVFGPFRQVAEAAQLLAHVAEDRAGLTRAAYDKVRTGRYQALVLADLARLLEEDVAVLARRADDALHPGVDPARRARTLAAVLTGTIRATATLIDTCHTLLGVAQDLVVIRRTRSRLELVAAVEMLRAAASTAHLTVLANLPRVTDSVLYDELAVGLGSLDVTLALAGRVSAALRSDTALGGPLRGHGIGSATA
jgi:hypothetical protein